MRRFAKMFVALLCAAVLFTACGKEKKESPFAALEDPTTSSSSSSAAQGGHPFASTSTPSSDAAGTGSQPPDLSSASSGAVSTPPQDSGAASSSQSTLPASSSDSQQTPPAQNGPHAATVRADGGLRLRAAAGENGEKLLIIPDGTQIECTGWQDGWAKTTYENQTGYVSAKYLLFYGTVRADGGLRLRKGPGENHEKLLTIPDGTQLACLEQKDGWIKTSYENQTGYVSQEYVRIAATVTAGPGLNLRDAPNETGTQLLTIPNGAQVQCCGNPEDGWVRVRYNGYNGYVSAEYLSFA